MRQTSLRELRRACARGRQQRDRLQSVLLQTPPCDSSVVGCLDSAATELDRIGTLLQTALPPSQLAGARDSLCQALEQLRQAGVLLASQLAADNSAALERARVDCFQVTQELQSIGLRLQADGPLRLLRLLEPQLTNVGALRVLWFFLWRPRRALQAANELVYCSPLWFWFVALVGALLVAHGVYFLFGGNQQAGLFALLQHNRQQTQQAALENPELLAAKLARHGLLLLHQKRAPDAYLLAQQALALKADHVPARCLTAMALVEMGRYQEGVAAYRALLKDNPADTTALNNLADLLATHPDPALRNGIEALQLASTACALSGQKNPTFLATLAEAQAELGRLPEAIATAQQARELARQQGHQDLAQTIQTRLEWFESGLPVRQPLR